MGANFERRADNRTTKMPFFFHRYPFELSDLLADPHVPRYRPDSPFPSTLATPGSRKHLQSLHLAVSSHRPNLAQRTLRETRPAGKFRCDFYQLCPRINSLWTILTRRSFQECSNFPRNLRNRIEVSSKPFVFSRQIAS